MGFRGLFWHRWNIKCLFIFSFPEPKAQTHWKQLKGNLFRGARIVPNVPNLHPDCWTPLLHRCLDFRALDEDLLWLLFFPFFFFFLQLMHPEKLERAKRNINIRQRKREREITVDSGSMLHTAVPCKDTPPRKLSSVMTKFSYCEYLSQFCNAEVIVVMFCRDCAEAGGEETGRAKENHSLFCRWVWWRLHHARVWVLRALVDNWGHYRRI